MQDSTGIKQCNTSGSSIIRGYVAILKQHDLSEGFKFAGAAARAAKRADRSTCWIEYVNGVRTAAADYYDILTNDSTG